MTNSIADILGKKNYDEPPEVGIIKTYVRTHLRSEVTVSVKEREILIHVSSGAMASALRPHLYKIAQACDKTTKRVVIRIGQ